MGRKKIDELVRKERARKVTFKKKKECLIRKTQELCKLCDVKWCIVIYDGSSCKPDIWPQNVDDIMELANKTAQGHNIKFELMDYFNLKKIEVEKQLSKLREKKYPTPVDMLDAMSESELRDFAVKLRFRAECVRSTLIHQVQQTATSSSAQGSSGIGSTSANDQVELIWGGSSSMDFGSELMSMMMNDVQQFGFGGTASSSMPSTGWEKDDDDGGLEDLLNFCMSSSHFQDSI